MSLSRIVFSLIVAFASVLFWGHVHAKNNSVALSSPVWMFQEKTIFTKANPMQPTEIPEYCRTINPKNCKVVNVRRLNPRDYYIIDYSNPKKPLMLLHFCMGDSLEAVAVLQWLRYLNITEQCALNKWEGPKMYYYLSHKKVPVISCPPNGFIRNGVMGMKVRRDKGCNLIPHVALQDSDVKVEKSVIEELWKVNVCDSLLTLLGNQEFIDRFWTLKRKYGWNRIGVLHQNWKHDIPDTPFLMHAEEEPLH